MKSARRGAEYLHVVLGNLASTERIRVLANQFGGEDSTSSELEDGLRQ